MSGLTIVLSWVHGLGIVADMSVWVAADKVVLEGETVGWERD